ncbi:MAG: caspase family protein, partial [Planctomycetaceae bacterium]|nr:caspase family protein [Planctomycetaceae bacterium]
MWNRSRSIGPLVLAVLVLSCCVPEATAQIQPEEDRPRLVPNTQGPASRVRSLGFSNDSSRLFAAGFDKTVHVWDVGWNNQQGVVGPDRAIPTRTLRWEIARADRGLINVMALSPGLERLAIAGVSARSANGDIILIDTARYEIERSLPPIRDEQTFLPGHTLAVVSVDFSPDGRRLISSSTEGSVWLWTETELADGRRDWTPTPIVQVPSDPEGRNFFNERPVLFLTNDLFVISQPLDPQKRDLWRLVLYSVARPQAPLGALKPEHAGRISALARSADGGTWASSDADGHIYLWTVGPQPTPRVLRQHDRQPSAMAFSPNGQLLAVANYLDPRSQSVVELWETGTGRMIDQVLVSQTEHTNSVAISPDGQFLATHADDLQEVLVYRLTTPEGALRPDPLPGEPTVRLNSRARRVTHAAFKQPAPGGPATYEIGFSTSPDRLIVGEFNFTQPHLNRLEQPSPPDAYIAPDAFSGGWSAVPLNGGELIQLSFNGAPVAQIPLNAKRQGVFEGAACIIPDVQGNPFAVAVGTSNQNGIFVYSLPQQGRPPRLLRYFRDHNGKVLSVGVSHDGRLLVSGAEDQTIKIWSLENLHALSPTFPQLSAWGADFRLENGQLVVRDVLKSGIAFGRELREGDVIAKMIVGRQELIDPVQIKGTLDQHPLWEQVLFTVNRGGQPLLLKPTAPGWEPLLTLLVDAGGEWALFTPEGYYDASVAEGHRLFGWQINRGRNFTPRFLQAESLQKDFERPEVIRNILAVGNVFDALLGAGEPVPGDFAENIASKAREVPDVKIIRPLANETFRPGQPMTIQAQITTPPQVNPDTFDVRTTLGGRFAGPPQQQTDVVLPDGRTQRTITLQTEAPDQINRTQVEITEKGEASILNSRSNSDKVFNRAEPPVATERYKLHFLALATSKYDGEAWQKLQYPEDDVKAIINSLYNGKEDTRLYEFGKTYTLFDELITPANVDHYVQNILSSISPAGPRDVVLVYLSGHGKAIDNEYYYIPPLKTNKPEDLKKLAIPWSKLAVLGDASCHVIWMLDTCQSGVVADVKSGVRNGATRGLVVAATSGDEEAFEGPRYARPGSKSTGHGAFTRFILDGVDGLADDDVEAQEERRRRGVGNRNGVVDIK